MNGFELAIPDTKLCGEFDKWAAPLLKQQQSFEKENRQLAYLRDTLLPKLMSGEVDVSRIELPTPPNNHLHAD